MGEVTRRFRVDFSVIFGSLGYMMLGVMLLLAIGVFFYGRILASSQAARDVALMKAEAAIDPATVENFIRVRDRLNSGTDLLANHDAFSHFFSLIETLLPSAVRFTSMHLTLNELGGAKLDGSGIAKSFNALAAASTAFAADGRIKDAIFSGIAVNSKDGSVSFTLTATLDTKLIAFSSEAFTPSVPEESTTMPPL